MAFTLKLCWLTAIQELMLLQRPAVNRGAATLTLFICNNNAACHDNHPNRKVMRRLNNDLRSIWARADAPVHDKLSLLKQTESSSQCAIQLNPTTHANRRYPAPESPIMPIQVLIYIFSDTLSSTDVWPALPLAEHERKMEHLTKLIIGLTSALFTRRISNTSSDAAAKTWSNTATRLV